MDIYAYSERGILNALFYEIAASADAPRLVHALLSAATFPRADTLPPPASRVAVLIEQSFSGFGSADAVLLCGEDEAAGATGGRSCTFIEAKVKTVQRTRWSMAVEYEEFRRGLSAGAVRSSNLFAQLYHKQQLVGALREGGVARLQRGVAFPAWSSRRSRKIGSNAVVLKATAMVQAHLGRALYLAIVPDQEADAAACFAALATAPHASLEAAWDASGYGFLTWGGVAAFCDREGLRATARVFAFNEGQIFGPQRPGDRHDAAP